MTTQIYTDGLMALLAGITPPETCEDCGVRYDSGDACASCINPSPREQLDNRVVAYIVMHMPKKLGPGDPGFMTGPEKLPLIPTNAAPPARNMSLYTLFELWKRFCEGDLEPSAEEAMRHNLLALTEEEFNGIQDLFTAYAEGHARGTASLREIDNPGSTE